MRGTSQRDRGRSRITRSLRRGLALSVALGVVISGLTLVPAAPASAAVVQWGTNSGTSPNYQANVNGDFVMAGNGVLACSGSALATGAGTCLNLHAASDANTNNVNDNFAMVNSNTVAGFTTNSSSATITVPAGATVSKAFLTWSGNTGVYTGDTRTLCAGFSTTRGVATMPAGSATGYRTQPIQFKVGAGAITNVAPQSMLEDPVGQATSLYYSASADVTSAFAVGTGAAQTISAGNIWTPTGAGCYAGWSLAVIYDYGTYIQGNNNSIPHRVIYYEGHVREGQNDAPLTVAFNGFTAVDAGTRAGFTLFEGDRNITGDTAQYARNGSATYAEINNSAGAAGNFGIGRAVGSTRFTQTADTSVFTNQSVDVATSTLTNVVQGDSTVNLRLSTTGDSYLLRNAILSVPTAGLQISKSYDGTADVQARTSAEKATFSITVTNTGAGTLRNIVVTDDQTDCARSLGSLVLAPLQSTTYTCTATAASAGTYESTASVTGYTLVGNYLAEDSDSTLVNLSSITLAKTSALPSGAIGRVGEVLTYTFTIRNNGSSPLTGVAVSDPLAGLSALTYNWPTGTAGALAAGATATATATYTLKQADVDSGSIVNTATTTGTDSDGGIKPTATATRTTTIAPASSIAVTKSATLAPGGTGKVGDVVNYSFTFQNSGNVTLTNVVFSDPLSGLSTPAIVWPGTAGTLIPGATATATANYTIKQSDVDAGSIKNTATVTGRTPAGATTTGSSPQVTVPTVASAPALTTTKSGVASGNAGVGQTITYTFRATNTGNVTLTNLTIADPLPGLGAVTVTGGTGTAAVLLPGQFVTATATYTIKQSDVDAGSVKNIATTTATIPGGTTISAPSTQSVVSTVASNPALTFTKSVSNPGTGKLGDVATYTFTLTNSGNVTLTGATITDPLSGLSAITVTGGTGTLASIAPGQTVIATATYTLKQSDVDAGSVANTATATATPPTGANVTRTAPATLVIPPASALTVTKTGTYTTGSGAVGSVITYTFTVKNDGNQTLTQVALADPLPGLGAITVTWPTPASPGRLLPGQTATATATYTVKQSDVDAGAVRNTATATAKNPAGTTVTGSSAERVIATVAASPAIATTKTSVIAGGAAGNAGDVITYSFTARNSGNVTLTGVTITDPLSGLSALSYSWPGTAGTLAPGATVTATATYTIKQADVNAGSVQNTATGSGKYGATTVSSTANRITATATAVPSIATTKSGALATGSTGRVGDTVNFTITLRNTGNVTLTNVGASDSLPGISAVTFTGWPASVGTLQPNQTVTGTATYTLLQSDVDAGSVVNTATGTGLPPTGAAVTSTGPATVPVASGPAITVSKTGAVTSGNGSVGDTMTFSFVVRNTGNVTLTGVGITDTLADLSSLTYSWPTATAGRLAPNTQATATATYVIKQSDVNTGSVKNTATASGTPPTGAAVTATSAQVSVPTAAAAPALTTTKVASPATGVTLGSTVNYTITVRNSGNVTLTNVTVSDTLIPTLSTTPATPATLAPNQTVTATGSYVVTQANIDSGAVRNTATSSGTYASTTVTSTSGSVVTPTVAAAPSIALTKTGTLAPGAQGVAGDVVTYTFTARNSGNVTLTGITIADPLSGLGAISITGGTGSTASLAPNQTVVYAAEYTLKQSDVDAGSVANTARTTGTPPTGAAVAATAPATVVIAPTASLVLTKTGSVAGPGVAGNTVTFSFTLYNPGNVTISGVTLSDSLAGLSTPVISWPGATGVIPAKATVLATATYVLKQSDVDTGSVTNTASISGKTPTNVTVTSPSSTATVQAAAPVRSSTTTKTASITSGARVGDVITYTIDITNTGNRTLSSVALTDSLAGLSTPSITWPGTAGTLLPAQAATAKATYVVTQADVDSGTISNQASTTATAPGNIAVSSSSAVVTTTTVTRAATLSLTKTGALAAGSGARAGDVVTYTFVLRNTGNVTLTGAAVTDPLTSAPSIPAGAWPTATVGTLPPNTQVTATATYTLQQSDVNAGAVSNTATGSANPPTGPAATTQSSATIPLTSGPSITVTKTGAVTSGNGSVNDTITFDFVVRNTGNVTLTTVGIDDTLVGLSTLTYTWPGTPGTLQPNTQATARATYVIKQADVNAGSVKNTATATGTPPTGPAVTATSDQVSVATVAASPTLTTNKTAIVSGTGAVNDVITYTIVGRNTGNVTLTGVTLADPLLGLQSSQLVWSGTPTVLQPGETVSVVATYTIQQTDLNNGSVANTATTRGTPPVGAEIVAPSTRVVTPTAPAAPRLTVTKVGVLPSGSSGAAGDNVTWTITLRNDGNVRLTGITVNDSLPGISPAAFGVWPGAPNVLDPGQFVIATATYELKQSDVDSGAVSNVATGTGNPPTGASATGTGAATIPLSTASSITIGKTAAYLGGGTGAVGDTVRYTFTATNTGNVTLTGVAISDPRAGLSAIAYGPWTSGTTGTLLPGRSVTATADYVVRQSDVNTGSITNTASVSGKPPTGPNTTATSPTVVIPTIARTASIAATKSATVSGTGAVADIITYTVTAQNTGSVTLTGVAIADTAPGLTPLQYGPWPGGVSGTLPPGGTVTATTTHTITQADVNVGSVPNTATATATSQVQPTVTSAPASVDPPTAAAAPDYAFTKTAVLAPGSTGVAGNTVNYAFTMTNTGNQTLTAVAISDPHPGLSAIDIVWPGVAQTLQPGQTARGTATYVLTQTDVDAGAVGNTATATAVRPGNETITKTSSATVPVAANPLFSITKVATVNGTGAVGDTISYLITLRNPGNVTLTDVTLTDSLAGLTTPVITWPTTTDGVLPPGQQATATANYTITQGDVDFGSVSNTATGSAKPPVGANLNASSGAVVSSTGNQRAELRTTKTASTPVAAVAGATITYTFSVRNTGNVTLSNIALNDPMLGAATPTLSFPATPGQLAPNAVATASYVYTITQADVDAGSVVNTATSAGQTLGGTSVASPPSSTTTATIAADPEISVTKSGTAASVAGDVVTWTFTVSNPGNVTLTGVSLTDSLPGANPAIPAGAWPSGVVGRLNPGDSFTVTSTSTVSQADVNSGALVNTVTATGTPARGAIARSTASASVPLVANAAISIVKTATAPTPGTVGQTVGYSFLVTNEGNVTLTGVSIDDELEGVSDVTYVSWDGNPAGTLGPNDELVATATYVLTQDDVDRGFVDNSATVLGTPPTGPAVDDTDAARADTIAPAPQLTTTKTADRTGDLEVGDVVTYEITVTNSGNTSVENIDIVDTLAGLGDLNYGSWPSGVDGLLLPGDAIVATAAYTVTQADIDAGSVTNTATGEGTTAVSGVEVSDESGTVVIDAIAADPSIIVTKSGVFAPGSTGIDGDVINYTLTLTNDGNVTLDAVDFSDTLAGLTPLDYTWPGTANTLLPGQTVTATTTYTVDQDDVDSGSVINVATGTAKPRGTATAITEQAASTVPIIARGSLSAVKTGTLEAGALGQVGDEITYVVTVTNTGNVTVYNGALLDPLPGISTPVIVWPNPADPGTLPVGQSVTGTAVYPLTQADVDRGFISNIADVAAASPGSPVRDVTATTNEVIIRTVQPAPGLAVTKTAVVDGDGDIGDEIVYTFTVENTGNVTIDGITLSDPLDGLGPVILPWGANTAHALAPGESITTDATYVIDQADLNAGDVRNTATASGLTPLDVPVTASSPQVVTPVIPAQPAISVDKTGALASDALGVEGDVVNYEFVIENTGNVRLTAVDLVDQLTGVYDVTFTGWNNGALPDGSLDPGDTATATAKYDLTQSDVDSGALVNTVTALGTPPRGSATTGTDSATIPITPTPELEVTKTGSLGAQTGKLGDTIGYTFRIENTGNVTLSGLVLSDDLAGVTAPVITWPTSAQRVLAPGQFATGTASYDITQADIDTGSVSNTATVRGVVPGDGAYTVESNEDVTATLARTSGIEVRKVGALDADGGVDDEVRYAIEIENTGNTTLTGVTLSDDMVGLDLSPITWPGADGQLLPGEIARATGLYTLTQADVNRGFVTNNADVAGTSPLGPVDDTTGDIVTDTAASAPSILVTKSGALAPGATGREDDVVTFTVSLTNNGNVTLTGVGFDDALVDIEAGDYEWPGTVGTLEPGQTVTATADYSLTQDDVDAGVIENTVTGTATPPVGAELSESASTDVTIAPAPELTPVKSAIILNDGTGAVGDVIQYTLRIKNDGNVTMYDGLLVDPMIGLGTPVITWPIPGQPRVLPPGTTVVGVATYTITQDDVDEGFISNIADVSARTPKGVLVAAQSNEVIVATVLPNPGLSVTKVGTPRGNAGASDTIDYEFRITNSGNVTMHGITLTDPLTGVTPVAITWPGATGELKPGKFATATASYDITLADVNAGAVINTASATGLSPDNVLVEVDSAPSTVPTEAIGPELTITDSGALAMPGRQNVGDLVIWEYELTNSGNVTLTGVALAEALAGVSAIDYYDWDGTPFTLEPGQSVRARATTPLTQAQIDLGVAESTVTGTGVPPRGTDVTRSTTAAVVIAAVPDLSVAKSSAARAGGVLGDTIDYTFTISNTGNVTLSLIDVVDALQGVSNPVFDWGTGPTGILAPGANVIATSTYVVTQGDVDAGTILNTATASGKPPVGDTITASSPVNTTTLQGESTSLLITKTPTIGADRGVGDVITYDFTITNESNVTLTDVTLVDALPGLSVPVIRWPGAEGVLAPDAVATATASYAIRQSDVDSGAAVNTASATGRTPKNVLVASDDAVATTTTDASAPDLFVEKTAALAPGATGRAGDLVTYGFTVTNIGNTTVTGVRLSDPLVGLNAIEFEGAGFPGGTLAPNASVTATATYELTQDDIDSGSVANTVTAFATPPSGVEFSETDSATLPIAANGALEAVKTGVLRTPGIGQVGDWVDYKLVITNTGNVTLYNGVLLDPLPGLTPPVITWPNPADPGTLAPGEAVTGTASVQLTQADVDLGYILNIADVRAFTPEGDAVDATSNPVQVATVLANPGVSVTKTGVATGTAGYNDTVDYTFVIRNTGNVTIGSIALTDPLDGVTTPVIQWPGAGRTLAPNATVTATASYTITQADVDFGSVTNTADVTAVGVRGGATSATALPFVLQTEDSVPTVTITNNGVLTNGGVPVQGDTVTWTYVFTNTGNVTLSGVALTDLLGGFGSADYTWSGIPGQLAPDGTVTVTRVQPLTQADIDSGSVSSIVTGTGQPPVGAVATASAPATVTLVGDPSLSITKTGQPAIAGQVGLGDVLEYEVVVTNDGDLTLTGVTLTDPLAGAVVTSTVWPAVTGVLAPTQSVTYSLEYTVQQEDVDRGSVSNVATANATSPDGPITSAPTAPVVIDLEAHDPSITTVKSGGIISGTGNAGSVIEYEFVVTNTGNVTLRIVTIVDELEGISTPVIDFPGTSNILAPGAVATGVARYTITQADVDSGQVANTAVAYGTSPDGTIVSGTSNEVVIDTAALAPRIETTQTAQLASGETGLLGDLMEYRFVITNTGNTTLTGVEMTNNTIGGLTVTGTTWPAGAGILLPGQSVVITATRAVDQADVDLGVVRNVTSAAGDSPTGVVAADDSPQSTVSLVTPASSLELAKTGAVRGGGAAVVGSIIDYTFTVTNTGAVTVTDVAVADPKPGLSAIGDYEWPTATEGAIPPGASATARASYTVTQADFDSGSVKNTASVSGTPARGALIVRDTSPQSVVPLAAGSPSITIAKTQLLAPGATGRAGDIVQFRWVVGNDGDVTLTGVTLTDAQARLGTITYSWPTATAGRLAIGEELVATANYVLTQADVDAGFITSNASTSGVSGAAVTVSDTTTGTTTVAAAPAMTVDKTHTLATTAQQGATVNYRIEVRNTGNVTLTGVTVDDALVGLSALTYTWPGTPGTIPVGRTLVVTARYTITEADVAAGTLSNTATANATAPGGAAVAPVADTDVLEIPRVASISLTITPKIQGGRPGYAGDVVVFTYVATNTGTEPLTNVEITDPRTGLSTIVYLEWPGEPGVLLPGQSITATATYVITKADEGTLLTETATVTSDNIDTGDPVVADAAGSVQLPKRQPDGLSITGVDPAVPLGMSLLLLLTGLGLIVIGRRKERKVVS